MNATNNGLNVKDAVIQRVLATANVPTAAHAMVIGNVVIQKSMVVTFVRKSYLSPTKTASMNTQTL